TVMLCLFSRKINLSDLFCPNYGNQRALRNILQVFEIFIPGQSQVELKSLDSEDWRSDSGFNINVSFVFLFFWMETNHSCLDTWMSSEQVCSWHIHKNIYLFVKCAPDMYRRICIYLLSEARTP